MSRLRIDRYKEYEYEVHVLENQDVMKFIEKHSRLRVDIDRVDRIIVLYRNLGDCGRDRHFVESPSEILGVCLVESRRNEQNESRQNESQNEQNEYLAQIFIIDETINSRGIFPGYEECMANRRAALKMVVESLKNQADS